MKKFILIAAWWCAAQLLLAQSQSYNIGATYQGGIIFYLDPSGAWGLAAAKTDLAPNGGLTWSQATNACNNLVQGGKGDWFLPSLTELGYMFGAYPLLGISGGSTYWSSTEFQPPPSTAAYVGIFLNVFSNSVFGKLATAPKVRPIRRFYLPLTNTGGEPACLPVTDGASFVPGPATITYGSRIDMKNNSRRMNITIGEMVVGQVRETNNSGAFGSLAGFLLPPFAPIVTASQGELLDRIQISWEPNPLGPLPTEGYKLYRDGVFLGAFDNKVRNFNDFNVIAGRPYKYEVVGINVYGDGTRGQALGFQVPNGVVTGYIQTSNNTPVVDAIVTLLPMQGFSLRFGTSDLAFANDTAGFLKNATNWTVAAWVQTDSARTGSKILEFKGASWSLTPLASNAAQEGVALVVGQTALNIPFPDTSKHAWHHVAITHDGTQFRAYLDGTLVGNIMAVAVNGDTKTLNIAGEGTQWNGRLDELRLYHRRLDELDFDEVIEGTASSLTPGLKYYWKMDEELGAKSFDVIGRNPLFFCGPGFDKSRPPVRTSGKTDSDGYYRIESANYGTGTTFIATPSKLFYMHRALKFVKADQDYATLPDFGLTDSTNLQSATLELWANSAGPDGNQCLLYKKWGGQEFRLWLAPNGNTNDLKCTLGGSTHTFGTFGMDYQHVALTFQQTGNNVAVKAYKNGTALGNSANFSGVSGNWSDTTQTWLVGACHNGTVRTDHFGGLLDELAVYDTILPLSDIQAHTAHTRDAQARHLRVYFAFDEGAGNQLNNAGAKLTGAGKSFGTDWTPFAANQMTAPHVFTPKTRQVTLNPSVTSVDQVDFTDLSTVAVSGFVRYKNTDCFAKNIEILVNGERFSPPIFTDSTGRFVIDFEPGATATLTPKFEDHQFLPASWEVVNVSSPIAGILFSDVTTRKIKGQIAGGHCKKSIISGPSEDCRIKVRTKDGCYTRELQVSNTDGEYEFENLPPIEMTIAVTKHNNFAIYTDFQTQGGRTIDLSKKDSTGVDFIYIAPPQVLVDGFEDFTTNCVPPVIVIPQWEVVTLEVTVYEQYGVGNDPANQCFLDSADLSINNTFDHYYDFTTPLDTSLTAGKFKYKFIADRPNPFEPFKRIIEIVADDQGRKSEPYTAEAIITGTVVGEAKFTTQLPMLPSYVLRDPPGDGSYAYLEKETKVCNSLTFGGEVSLAIATESEYTQGSNIETTLPFVGTHVEAEIEYSNSKEFTTTLRTTTKKNMEYCVTNRELLATDDGDLIVGGATLLDLASKDTLAGNDVYVGVGFNIIFSDSKEVSFNNCQASVAKVTTVSPDTFVTNYKYSEWNLERNVIRYLDTLIANGFDADGINTTSKKRWENYIKINKAAKKAAKYQQNISFDAGVQYEASTTIDTTIQWESEVTTEFASMNELFFEVKVIKPITAGGTIDATITVGGGVSAGKGSETATSWTTGYVLKDDDPGDTWSIDVKADPLYHTPVFDVKAGQSSCPWEVGTAHRDGISMIPMDGTFRTGVPSNEAAVFHFLLGNNSSTFEDRTYVVNTGPESNPDGAIVKLNGAILDHNVAYAVAYGAAPLPITITVERGPQAYSYQGVEVVTFVTCHDDRCTALGFAPDNETFLYSANYLSVDFIEPCSEVDIDFPFDGWVIKPDTIGNPDVLPITVSGYDLKDVDFTGVRVQYRPSNGDGAWINITNGVPDYIPKSNLGPVFTRVDWNTGGATKLADGAYEIRALTVCSGGPGDNTGYSHIVKGRIERQPPSIVGVPQPSDGVFNVGDEISFTFNKPIQCGKLIQADQTQPNNVGLYDAATGDLIDVDITCYENKITLVPRIQNKYLENKILRAELHNISDLIGNKLVSTKWEFFVDRNELAWLTDSMGITKTEGETKTVTASIQNRGGSPMPFTITGAPAWVRVVPDKGTLVPNEIRPIRFEVDSSLAFGLWKDTVTLHTETGANPFFMGGDEALPVGVRVVCRPPNWDLDAGIHPVTMNMVVSLNVQGALSTDEEDLVAAFIDGELRGRARIQYFPSVNKYLAHLTIYGESAEVTKPITLQIWDASACLRYSTVLESFTFQPDNVVGTPVNPQVLHTNSLVLREIPLNNGWNWISFNLAFPNTMLDPALASLNHPDNGLIKDQNNFSMYSSGWFGSLTDLGNTSMYQYRASQPDTLNMMGNVIDPSSVSIPLGSGWNWLGYLPNYSLSVDAALGSLTAATGDLIKGQYGFSQFVATYGWIGNLKFMYPPQGYQLRLTSPGALTYPPNTGNRPTAVEDRGEGEQTASYWQLDPTKYEHSMTLVGMLASSGQNTTLAEHELGAFVGNELRGAAKAIYVAPLNAYLFFLTTYANTAGEQIKFKLYHATTGQISPLSETMFFAPDLHQGTIQAPVPFSLPVSGAYETVLTQSLEVQPNPFTNVTSVRFGVARDQAVQLSITDLQGREIQHFRLDARQGLNTWTWQPEVGAGVYFIRLQTAEGTAVRKVVKS